MPQPAEKEPQETQNPVSALGEGEGREQRLSQLGWTQKEIDGKMIWVAPRQTRTMTPAEVHFMDY